MKELANSIAQIVSQDCYKRDINENLHLKAISVDLSNVGVELNSFNDEWIFEEGDFDLIIHASDFGVESGVKANMGEKLKDALEAVEAYGKGKKKLVLPKGEIYVYDVEGENEEKYTLRIDGIDDLYVDGGGATLMVGDELKGVGIVGCQNVCIRNLKIDRINLPYLMGRIETMDKVKREAIIEIQEGYEVEDHFPFREYLEFDLETKEPRYHGNFLYNNEQVDGSVLDILSFKKVDKNRAKIEFGCEINQAPPGTGLVMAWEMYGKNAVTIHKSNNTILENVDVYSAPGMGVVGYSSENIYLNRVNVMCKPDTDRVMTTTADAMHFNDCSKDLQITNCLLENSHDDSLNVHGMYMMVTDIDSELKRVRFAGARTVKYGRPNKEDTLTMPYHVGDEIELSEDDGFGLKAVLTVTSCEEGEDYGYWVTFKEGTSSINKGDVLSNITRLPKLLVRNCIMRNKRNRGMLVQTRDSLIENNTLYNVIMTGIQIMTDCATWYESVNPKNVVVRNNKFINTNIKSNNFGDFGHGDIDICVYGRRGIGKAGLIKDIQIENNAFVNSGNAAVSVNSAEGVVVKNNSMYHPCSETVTTPTNCAISVSHSRQVTLVGNVIVPSCDTDFCDVYFGDMAETDSIVKDNIVVG